MNYFSKDFIGNLFYLILHYKYFQNINEGVILFIHKKEVFDVIENNLVVLDINREL